MADDRWWLWPVVALVAMILLALLVEFIAQPPIPDLQAEGHYPQYRTLQEGTHPGAKITLVEFTDFQCPYCQEMHPIISSLRERFGDDLNYVVKHIPNPDAHPQAPLAAVAVECARDLGVMDDYVDLVFAHQDALYAEDLIGYAKSLGLDEQDFTACLSDEEVASRIQDDLFEAKKVQIRGTPTFFINGARLQGVQKEQDLVALMEALKDE